MINVEWKLAVMCLSYKQMASDYASTVQTAEYNEAVNNACGVCIQGTYVSNHVLAIRVLAIRDHGFVISVGTSQGKCIINVYLDIVDLVAVRMFIESVIAR